MKQKLAANSLRALTIRVVVFALLAGPSSFLAAEQWLEFRGGDGSGHSTAVGLPETWSVDDNVLWRSEIPGQGWSSAVSDGKHIYLTTAIPAEEGNAYALALICLDAQSGKSVWQTKVFGQSDDSPKIHKKNTYASPTPIIAGDRIVVHFGHEGTACVSTKGDLLWENRELKYPPVHGNGGSPVIVKDRIIFSCDAGSNPFVAGLDFNSGKLLWKTARSADATRKFSFSTPLVLNLNGETQIVSPGSDAVCGYDLDGNEIWKVRYDGYSVVPKPVFANGLIYVCTGFNQPSLLAIRPGGEGDVTETHVEWSIKAQVPHTPSVIVVEDLLFMVSDKGVISCLEASSGEQVWRDRLDGNGFSASPIFGDGKIYFTSEDGVTSVVRPTREFSVIAKNKIEERTLASIGIVDQSLLLRTDAALYRISAK